MTPTITTTWYSLVGPREGEIRYGEPLAVQVVFTPTAIVTGTVQSSIRLTATLDGGGARVVFIPTRLQAFSSVVGNMHMYVPAVTKAATFAWAEPDSGGRDSYAISETESIVVDLPFTMTMGERKFTNLRIYGDGFAVGSASAVPDTLPNLCLANQLFPPFAVYGWWSALDVGSNGELSTFQSDDDHFVIEYDNFRKTGSFDPDDNVTFQIVLARNGQVRLNYEHVPEHLPTSVTVGASRDDGRFYNQIACHIAGTVQLGELPANHQSFLLTPGDLY